MILHPQFPIKRVDLILFGILGFAESAAVTIFLALQSKSFTGFFLFGATLKGFVELTLLALMTLLYLVLILETFFNWSGVLTFFQKNIHTLTRWLLILLILGLLLGWAAATIPPDFFGRFSAYYQWLRPAGLVSGLFSLQGGILYLFRSIDARRNLCELSQHVNLKIFFLTLGLSVLGFLLIYKSGFGVVADLPLWNVPGVPISGMQMAIVSLGFLAFYLLETFSARFRVFVSSPAARWVLAGGIFLGAVLVWGLTPLRGDSLAVETSIANPQPYPLRDARVHDLGAISILFGEGINFSAYTDKPFFMVILAFFHLITGYDYQLLQWVQIIVLALLPVLASQLGKHFHSSLFGIVFASLTILQQRNAIVLSRMISSVNVKILVTETFVFLGILFLVLLLFKWNDQNDKQILLISGGLVGCLSLIRLNPLIFVPFISLVILIHYWKKKKILLSRLALFLLGFAILFTPWVISGTNAEGQPFLLIKIQDILETRISPQLNSSIPAGVSTPASGSPTKPGKIAEKPVQLADFSEISPFSETVSDVNASQGLPQYGQLFANHFVHNIFASLLPLPDVLSRKGISALAERDYWNETRIWDGTLSGGLIRFILLNLALISLGIAFSWKKYRWRGLIPLGFFFVYDLAISLSLTSGGRYIVPIIWIVFFYYALGLVFLLERIVRLLAPRGSINRQPVMGEQKPYRAVKMWPLLIPLILTASFIPIANQLLPAVIRQSPLENAAELFALKGPIKKADARYQTGVILYPTYKSGEGRLSFAFCRQDKVRDVQLDLFPKAGSMVTITTRLRDGEPVLLEMDEEKTPTRLFILRDDTLVEYWSVEDASNR
ncbi:MAG: hypothetical protein ABFC97_04180 [Anaerolineaceae bacterium]